MFNELFLTDFAVSVDLKSVPILATCVWIV